MKVTIDMLRKLGACYARVGEHPGPLSLWPSGEADLADILAHAGVGAADKRWLVARLMSPHQRVAWACDCAEGAARFADEQTRDVCLATITTVRAWLHGEATIDEVQAAIASAREARRVAAAAAAAAEEEENAWHWQLALHRLGELPADQWPAPPGNERAA